jgi:CubicO group peptidase (beta-lactamase class C family)
MSPNYGEQKYDKIRFNNKRQPYSRRKMMRKLIENKASILIISLFLLLTFSSCSSQKKDQSLEQRIQSVENGLTEVNVMKPQEIFQADRSSDASADATTPPTARQPKMTLSERMQQLNVPGLSLAVIDDYEIAWVKAYGILEAGKDAPVTPETLFEAASTSKLLASITALSLVEQGLLDLDKDVNHYLKSWKIPENSFTSEHEVTLRLLLTHQSGLNRPDGGFDYEEGTIPSLVQVLKGEAPAKNQPAVVEYVPGTKQQYSNIGYLVIQQILEDVLDKPYPQIIEEKIFTPLGISSSTFTFPFEPELESRVAKPHDQEGKAHPNGLLPSAVAHGGLVTTPHDLARVVVELMRAYQGRSGRIVSQETLQQMFIPVLDLDPGESVASNSQGLGVFLIVDKESVYFSHPGGNYPGSVCMLFASPIAGKGAVIMTNSFGGWQLALEILATLVDEYDWPTIEYK